VPSCGVLFGAYVHPVGAESQQQAYARLQRATGSHMRVLHFYHQGTELFPTSWEIHLASHHRRLLLNWKPEDGHTWAKVAAGASDGYIDAEASYLRHHYTKKFYLVIHHEPENDVVESPGSGYTASDYAAMFRHVEDRLKADGVHNAVYVLNYMGAQTYFVQPWHKDLWPGRKYVDWIGLDRYATPSMGGQQGGFKAMVNRHWGSGPFLGAYRWAARNYPHKPVMLVEWAVSEKPGDPGWKSRLFKSVPRGLHHMKNLKLISYFDSPVGDAAGDVRPNTTSRSFAGWKRLAAKPVFHK
jgi:hypothetical protein